MTEAQQGILIFSCIALVSGVVRHLIIKKYLIASITNNT